VSTTRATDYPTGIWKSMLKSGRYLHVPENASVRKLSFLFAPLFSKVVPIMPSVTLQLRDTLHNWYILTNSITLCDSTYYK
jgi:hypothetical protein